MRAGQGEKTFLLLEARELAGDGVNIKGLSTVPY